MNSMPRGGALSLPPPYTLHRIDEGCVLEHAVRLAPAEGAGTLVVTDRPGLLAFAVVLEPEAPLAEARLAFLVAMAALADALAAHCPPERPIRFTWPDGLTYDRGRIGGGRMQVAPGTAEDAVPDWIVFAAELIADRDHLEAPGAHPQSTSLREEEFDENDRIVEAFAAYLMLYFDRWRHEGLDSVLNRYLMRIDPPMLAGTRRIEGGALVERSFKGAERRVSLAEGFAASTWRGEGGPRL